MYSHFKLPEKGICAHRGETVTCPESTMSAFKNAIQLGVQMIEFDVNQSKDGHFFISHDKTLERINGGNILLSELNWADLQKLDVGIYKGEQFRNERIQSLEKVLKIMPLNIWILVHLSLGDLKMAQDISRIVSRGRQHQVILGTNPERIKAAREVCPEIKTFLWKNECPNTQEYVNDAIELKVDFLRFWNDHWAVKTLSQELVDKTKAAGIKILYCEALNADDIVQLFERGIDFPIPHCAVSEAMDACRKLNYPPVKAIFPEDIKN